MNYISKEAEDLIVEFEVGSKAQYEQKYRKPMYPGVKSGVTIGIGYDVGYVTKEQLWKDWKGIIPDSQIIALESALGVTGAAASAKAKGLRDRVDITWDQAMAVYRKTVLPRWEAKVRNSLPNTDKISATSFGVLVSLAYNRGPSFSMKGDRYTEMRNIKTHMANKEFAKIPAEIRSMKRIWVGTNVSGGLSRRREAEAKLFEKGLKQPVGGSEVTTGAVIIAGGAAAATQTDPIMWPWIIGGTAIALIAGWMLVRWYKKVKVAAEQEAYIPEVEAVKIKKGKKNGSQG